jgi:hypothetical protein
MRLAALSALALLLAAAGAGAQTEAPAAPERWVNASGVILRGEPSASAAIVARLAINTPLRLIGPAADTVYCEVQRTQPDGAEQRGFTACRYLADAPIDVARLTQAALPDGTPNPQFDPVRRFQLAPSWAALEAYALHLNATRLPAANDAASMMRRNAFERAPDAELERMKAHLALGIHGPAPRPFVAWDELQRRAQSPTAWPEIGEVLGLASPLLNLLQSTVKAEAMAAAVARAIALPTATPSWFKEARQIARLDDDTALLSGRFGIVHTYRTQARAALPVEGWDYEGLWDIGAVTTALTRPVQRTTLFRDARMTSAPTHARQRQMTWGGSDAPMCHGWLPGFAHGDAEPKLWAADKDRAALKKVHPSGSLVVLHTREPLPAAAAVRHEQTIALDRAATGFVRETQMHFDLDGDGDPDLVAWEGTGKGPGHLDGPTTTDDAWHRLFFVNIAGRWFVLGHDSFSYGCGC